MNDKTIQRKLIWEFVLFVGAMFSGKSSRLISAIERHQIRGSKILCFKPTIDGRYAEYAVVTHGGGKMQATPVSNGEQILKIVEKCKPDVVAVDEAFMIDGCADALIEVFQNGTSVYVSSIELSSNLKSFYEENKTNYPYDINRFCFHIMIEKGITNFPDESIQSLIDRVNTDLRPKLK